MIKTTSRLVCTAFCLSSFVATAAVAQQSPAAAGQPQQQPAGSRPPITAPGIGNPAYRNVTHLTFSGPVQLPGASLDAGEYVFSMADPADGRNVVQVTSADGKKTVGVFPTRVVSRPEVAQKPEVNFLETPANVAPAIKTVWFDGQSNGVEFVYSKEQTDKIMAATTSSSPAQSAQNSSNASSQRPAASTTTTADNTADAARNRSSAAGSSSASTTTSSTTTAPSSTTTSSTTTAPSARSSSTAAPSSTTASTTTAGAPGRNNSADRQVGTTGSAPAQNQSTSRAQQPTNPPAGTANTTRSALPKTGSSLPLVSILGGLALAGAAVMRARRLSRS